MPELAEVEFYRTLWNCGLNHAVLAVHLHPEKRIFRGTDTENLQRHLRGHKLLGSETHGKQMMFQFAGGAWLGIHLGMTGTLRVEKTGFQPEKHDHLVLGQKSRALVFSDPRQFGRILFHVGKEEPEWWRELPPRINSPEYTREHLTLFLKRHGKAPIKAVLLMQNGFPGVGNWMADEILWQAKVHPRKLGLKLTPEEQKALYQKTRLVCEQALLTIGKDFSDPPASWLFRHRWKKKAKCPRCKAELKHATIGGRTTCWCATCQK